MTTSRGGLIQYVKFVRNDGANGFPTTVINDFYADHGIEHQVTARYAHQTRPTQQYGRAQHPQYCDYGSQYAVPRAFEQVIVG